MPISERDFALLQEEVKCLRKKFGSTVGTSGGYVDGPLTGPDSSIFPDSYYDCDCYEVQAIYPDPIGYCNPDITETTPLGDMGIPANDVINNPFGSLFVFDKILGVRYKGIDDDSWENRNIGLSDQTLEHGAIDAWWYRKTTPSINNVIMWRVGLGKALRSNNAGRDYWQPRNPAPPTGISLSNVNFVQVISSPFIQNQIILLANSTTAPWKTWIVQTRDDGQEWDWLDITTYNGRSHKQGIWMSVHGGNGSILWVTAWTDDKLVVLKVNNDPTMTVSAEYVMNDATQWEVDNRWETLSPVSQVDSGRTWFYGRASNPDGLGLSHIIYTDDEGLNFSALEQGYGNDWVGSLKVSLADDSGNRNLYAVRNIR